MQTVESLRPLLAVLVSLGAVPLIILSGKRPNLREGWTFLAAGVKFALVLSLLPLILGGAVVDYTIVRFLPGLGIALRVDSMGMVFALVSSFLWIVTSAYSIGYMRGLKEHSQTRYFCFFAVSLSATIGVAFSANLLTLYLFYEMLSFSTYPLVTHHQDAEARSSGRKYLGYIVGPSIGLLLPAMLVIHHLTGTLTFSKQGVFTGGESGATLLTLLLVMLFGFAKAGIMPLHSWLPAAMVAPTPVSALLHAVAVVKVGVFCILRVTTGIFGTNLLNSSGYGVVMAVIAAVTIITASIIALSQDSLKGRRAFSTVSQLSYIVLGTALLSPLGIMGSMLHITMHAFGKITLFFCAGAIYVSTGTKYISQMNGIGRKMPLTLSAFFIGSLSVIGLPPAGGFLSKWYLVLGTLEADRIALLFILLLSSILNAAYFMPIVYRAFFCDIESARFTGPVAEAPLWCLVPLLITATCSVLLLFFPQPFYALAEITVTTLFRNTP